MPSHDLIRGLLVTTVAGSAAILVVLLLRRPLRRRFGAGVAYAAWSIVFGAMLAVMLPAADVAGTMVFTNAGMPLSVGLASVVGSIDEAGVYMHVLVVAWLLGAGVLAAVMVRRQRNLRRSFGRLHRQGREWRAEARAAGLPATIGFWRPRVVVPADFESRYTGRERELVLLHEHAHVARGDLQANAIAVLLNCIFWFNPLFHLAVACFRHDQELACDAHVVGRHPGARRMYADALFRTQLATQALPLACHFGFGHPFKERIVMLGSHVPSSLRRTIGIALVSTLAAGTAFAAWALQPQTASTQKLSQDAEVAGASLEAPKYPKEALEQDVSGKVVLIVDIAADGSVDNVVVDRAEPAGVFDAATREAVMKWKFNPAIHDGKAVPSRVRVPIWFKKDQAAGAGGKS